MKTIDVITHVYAGALPQYAAFLRWQAGSLVYYPPERCRVNLVICFTPEDERTVAAVKVIASAGLPPTVGVSLLPLDPARLFRRAIGRHIAFSSSTADVCWACDVDHAFGPGCLDAVCEQVQPSDALCFPREVRIQRDHETGDAMVAGWKPDELPAIDPALFTPRRERRAIGGLMIVGVDTARRGYLDGTHWQNAPKMEAGFLSCRCDRAYRKWLGSGKGRAIDVPGVFRARHSSAGRDYDLAGENRGRKVWR